MRLTTSPPSRAERYEILESKLPGTLRATAGLLRDFFSFYPKNYFRYLPSLQNPSVSTWALACPLHDFGADLWKERRFCYYFVFQSDEETRTRAFFNKHCMDHRTYFLTAF